ncbi:MAG: nucleotidyltransferase domain-containing protein, partial [Candidatus Micrarchaeota archaeon]
VEKENLNFRMAMKFKGDLAKKINLSKLLMFGSRAKGVFAADSDFDFIVVSPDFLKIPRRQRYLPVRLLWKFDYSVDILCYTPEEFEKRSKSVSIANEALKTGIVI